MLLDSGADPRVRNVRSCERSKTNKIIFYPFFKKRSIIFVISFSIDESNKFSHLAYTAISIYSQSIWYCNSFNYRLFQPNQLGPSGFVELDHEILRTFTEMLRTLRMLAVKLFPLHTKLTNYTSIRLWARDRYSQLSFQSLCSKLDLRRLT